MTETGRRSRPPPQTKQKFRLLHTLSATPRTLPAPPGQNPGELRVTRRQLARRPIRGRVAAEPWGVGAVGCRPVQLRQLARIVRAWKMRGKFRCLAAAPLALLALLTAAAPASAATAIEYALML
jgi:hypothetical protein